MKRIFLILTVTTATMVLPVRAQDVAALEERVNKLNGYIQDLQEDRANQKKQIEALSKEIQSLREHQQNQSTGTFASQDDLRELAKKVAEIDKKREADRDLILKEIKNLGKGGGVKVSSPRNTSTETPRTTDLPPNAIEHTVADGEFLSTIAAAYSKEKGVKITTALILKANPNLKPEKMKVGQKILIPIPEK